MSKCKSCGPTGFKPEMPGKLEVTADNIVLTDPAVQVKVLENVLKYFVDNAYKHFSDKPDFVYQINVPMEEMKKLKSMKIHIEPTAEGDLAIYFLSWADVNNLDAKTEVTQVVQDLPE